VTAIVEIETDSCADAFATDRVVLLKMHLHPSVSITIKISGQYFW